MGEQGPLFGELLVRLGLVSQTQVQEALALQALTGQRIGEALISLGYVTRDQLQQALSEALGITGGAKLEQPPLGEILLGLKYLTAEQLEGALQRQKRDGRKLGEVLVDLGLCTYQQIYEGLGLQQRMAGHGPARPAAAQGKPDSVRVLVVDDSPLACKLVEEGLTELGYDVVSFQDPFEALEQVYRLKPAIVLTDLDMPGLDGAELCRRLKSGPARSVPVIILTVNDADSTRISGLRAGADDFVRKGASMGELAARIDSIVRRTGETERMRQLFARYTSDAVVEEILKHKDIVLTGEKREVTVLFADIRNFTALAETLPAEQVVAVLNEALGRMADAVLTCGGTLDKFLGDGLMAVFGAPVAHDDDALRALQAGRMMMESVQQLNEVSKQELAAGLRASPAPTLELGIGINSGPVVAGNLGSARRTEYTCIGDAVNVGSRLCSLARPGEILVGERTCELVGVAGPFEALAPVQLKGKSQPVKVFRASWQRRQRVDIGG